MTVTSKGTFAYNDYPNNGQGDGFSYLGGDNLLFEGSLILGTSANKISDGARGSDQGNQNTDFSIVQPFILDIPGEFSDIEGTSIFNDNGAGGNKIGIETHLNTYTLTSTGDEKYIILDYRFINTNSSNVNNLFAGLFFDWDFADAVGDISGWDNAGGFGYVYRDGGAPDNYVGVGLISSEDFGFWAILNGGGDGGFQIYDGFDDSEKWTAISSGLGKLDAGTGDVSHVVSAGPYNISAGDTLRVAFAVMGADDLSGLQLAIANARTKFNYIITSIDNETSDDNLPNVFALEQNYPNPFNPTTRIKYSIPSNVNRETSNVSLIIYDILGTEIATLANEKKAAGNYVVEFDASGLSSGIYFYTLRSGSFTQTRKMIVLK